MWNTIIEKLRELAYYCVSFLPESPFQQIEQDSEIAELMGFVNYFVPFDFAVAVLVPWLTAISVYYIYQAILRLAKVVE